MNENAARLVPALCAFLTVIVTFGFGRRILGTRGALLGAFALTVMAGFVHCGRYLILDSVLTFSASPLFFKSRFEGPCPRCSWWLASSVCCDSGCVMKKARRPGAAGSGDHRLRGAQPKSRSAHPGAVVPLRARDARHRGALVHRHQHARTGLPVRVRRRPPSSALPQSRLPRSADVVLPSGAARRLHALDAAGLSDRRFLLSRSAEVRASGPA